MPSKKQAKQAFDAMSKDPNIYYKMNDDGKRAVWEYGRDNGYITRDILNDKARGEFDKYVGDWVKYAPKVTNDPEMLKADKYANYNGTKVPLSNKKASYPMADPQRTAPTPKPSLKKPVVKSPQASTLKQRTGVNGRPMPVLDQKKLDKAAAKAAPFAAGAMNIAGIPGALGLNKEYEKENPNNKRFTTVNGRGIPVSLKLPEIDAYSVGNLIGMGATGGVISKAVSPVTRAVGKKLTKVAAKKVVPAVIEAVAQSAGYTVPQGVIQGKSGKEIAKETALNTALFVGMDAGIRGVGKLGKNIVKTKELPQNVKLQGKLKDVKGAKTRSSEIKNMNEYYNNLEYQDYVNSLDPAYVAAENAARAKKGLPEITAEQAVGKFKGNQGQAQANWRKAQSPKLINQKIGKLNTQKLVEPNIRLNQNSAAATPTVQEAAEIVRSMKIDPENRAAVINDLIKNSDKWKDKKMTALTRETWERNIVDIAGKEDGQKVIDAIFTPIHQNEAARIRFMNSERAKVKALKLSGKESEVVQKLGEGLMGIDEVPAHMNKAKLQNAVQVFRDFYDRALPMVNDSLARNGYKEVGQIKSYFPHFEGDDPVLKALGVNIDVSNLPTDINGLSHQFRPGKNWAGNLLRRTGNTTTYDAVQGFDKYIDSVSKVIHHTDDIKNLRELNKALRSKYSTPEIQAEIDGIFKSPDLSQEAKEAAVEELLGRSNTHLSNSVADLGEYTNVLAGKKDLADRAMERTFGRQAYNVTNFVINRIAKNMVAVNPASWATNFIPITQAAATTGKKETLQAMLDTIADVGKAGFRDKSTFLTNRYGSEILSKGATDKVGDVLTKPMQWIDHFTSNVVTRSKYFENIKKGMPEDMAMQQADEWAAKIIGDRSLGSQPTLFNSRNPLYRVATQFQLEVNNQLSFLFKDMPRSAFDGGSKKKAIAKLSAQYGQIAFYGYLYNELYKQLTGRRPAIDPIGFLKDTKNDMDNPNLSKGDVALNAIQNGTGQLPFVGGLIGGGRLPVMNAMSDVRGVIAGTADAQKELTKPLYYLLPPFGGGQAKKTIEALSAIDKGGVFTKSGNMRYPINDTIGNKLKGSLFGVSSLQETQNYYNNKEKPLSEKQTEKLLRAKEKGKDTGAMYNKLLNDRMIEKVKSQIEEIVKDKTLSYEDRIKKLEPLQSKLDILRKKQ